MHVIIRRSLTEAKSIFDLAAPLVLGSFAMVGMSVTDTIIAGWAGANDLAGLAISVNLWVPVSICLMGSLSALVPLTAREEGRGDRIVSAKLLFNGLFIAVISGLMIAVLIPLLLPLLKLLNAEPRATLVAQDYLSALRWGLPAMFCQIAMQCWFSGLGRVRPVMIISMILFLLNIPLDYALVMGKWGFPRLGGAGCGWATVIASWVALICSLIYLATSQKLAYYRANIWHCPQLGRLKSLIKLGFPIGLAAAGEEGFISILVLFAAPLGTAAIGGLQVAASYLMLAVVLASGISQAITIRTAFALGKFDYGAFRFTCYQGIIWGLLLVGLLLGLALIYLDQLIGLFSNDPAVIKIASGLLLLSPLAVIPNAVQQFVNGALRGFRDTAIPMFLMLVSYWCLAVPLTYLMIDMPFSDKSFGVTACYIGYTTGFSAAALLLFRRLRQLLANKYSVCAVA